MKVVAIDKNQRINEGFHYDSKMLTRQVENAVEVFLQKKSPKSPRKKARDHPHPHAATVIVIKVLRGIQFRDWKQKNQAWDGISAERLE